MMNNRGNARHTWRYQIRVEGVLDKSWSNWLNCNELEWINRVNEQTPVTEFTCLIPDLPALRGLLNKIFDLNLKLLSLNRIDQDPISDTVEGSLE